MGLLDLFKRARKPATAALAEPVMRELPAPLKVAPDAPPSAAPQEPEPLTSTELRIMLFDAIATGDEAKLARLCRDHHDFLVEYADTWSVVPDALHANPEAARWYGEGFHAIARFCAEKLDRKELLARLDASARRREFMDSIELDAHAA